MLKNHKSIILFAIFVLLLWSCSGGTGEDLLDAVNKGDLPRVVKLLNNGVDANTVDAEGVPVLVRAIKKRQQAISLELLKHNALPNPRKSGDDIPLCLALKADLTRTSVALIRHGAELNVLCRYIDENKVSGAALTIRVAKTQPFMMALKKCNAEVVSAIMDRTDLKNLENIDEQEILEIISNFSIKKAGCLKVSDLVLSISN